MQYNSLTPPGTKNRSAQKQQCSCAAWIFPPLGTLFEWGAPVACELEIRKKGSPLAEYRHPPRLGAETT